MTGTAIVQGAGWHAEVHGVTAAMHRQLDFDLGGFLAVGEGAPAEGSVRLARIEVCVRHDRYDEWRRRTADLRYRDIVMHYPRRPQSRRFGRVTTIGDDEVVFGTTKRSIVISTPRTRSLVLLHTEEIAAAKEVRRIVRDQLFIPWTEQSGGIVIHSSAFVDEHGRATVVVAPGGGGKTTFFLAALASGRHRLLSSDRTILAPDGASLRPFASPEKINLFPGSLAAYPQSAHVVADRDPLHHWQVEHKFHLRWPDLFALFGGKPAAGPADVHRIIVPRFADRWSVTPLSGDPLRQALQAELLTGGEPVFLPNWLAWYRWPGGYDTGTFDRLAAVPAVSVTWSDVRQVDRYVAGLADDD